MKEKVYVLLRSDVNDNILAAEHYIEVFSNKRMAVKALKKDYSKIRKVFGKANILYENLPRKDIEEAYIYTTEAKNFTWEIAECEVETSL